MHKSNDLCSDKNPFEVITFAVSKKNSFGGENGMLPLAGDMAALGLVTLINAIRFLKRSVLK